MKLINCYTFYLRILARTWVVPILFLGILIYGSFLFFVYSSLNDPQSVVFANPVVLALMVCYLFIGIYLAKIDEKEEIDVKLFIANDISQNAFAVGRKTICVLKGLLSLPEEEIQALIAHEFAHLSHKDTDINLVVYVGNIFINVIMFFVRIVLTIFLFIFEFPLRLLLGMFEDKTPRIERTITYGDAEEKRPRLTWSGAIVDFLWSLWILLGVLFIRSSTRQSEYHADLFAYELGYGEELASALDRIEVYIPEQGFLKAMYSTHPSTDDRIARLQELGSEYTNYSL